MKKLSFCFILLLFVCFTGCSLTTPKAYFTLAGGRVTFSQPKKSDPTILLSMENLWESVIYINDSQGEPRKFGNITMSEFLNLFDVNDRFDELNLNVTFCFVEPKTNNLQQYSLTVSSPQYDRERKNLSWKVLPSKRNQIPLGTYEQNVLSLSLDVKQSQFLFKNAYSYD